MNAPIWFHEARLLNYISLWRSSVLSSRWPNLDTCIFSLGHRGGICNSPGLSVSTVASGLFLAFLRMLVRSEQCQGDRGVES